MVELLPEWFSKKPEDLDQLFGVRYFWWNRSGVFLQFIGGFFVLAEIIGDRKVKNLSTRILNTIVSILGFFAATYVVLAFIFWVETERFGVNRSGAMLIILAILYIILAIAYLTSKVRESDNLHQAFKIIAFMFFVIGSVMQILAA